jgi:hypothetical protein
MARVAIFIGVDKTGKLPKLKDAAASAERLAEQWARKQGIEVQDTITDKGGVEVTTKRIKDAVNAALHRGDVEQLLIYFAGHGVNVRMGEYWLLSGAPDDVDEAVNVRGSDDLARYCGVPHVVFISDACRTAADSIQAQNVTGSLIFPNLQVSGKQKPVDLFYACALGRPAHEVRDVQVTANEFQAIYTQELLDALCFKHPTLVQWQGAAPEQLGYIRPRPLRDHLESAVARRIQNLDLQTKVIQIPDAHITSEPDAWLCRMKGSPPPPEPISRRGRGSAQPAVGTTTVQPSSLVTARTMSRTLLNFAIEHPIMAGTALGAATTFGPVHFETNCGFKISGARFADAFAHGVVLERLGPSRDVVRVGNVNRPGANVLLVLDGGAGVVLPAIPDFIAALSVEDGELVDVSYEPSDYSGRWQDYKQRATELRILRRAVASATRAGVFRLERGDALSLARRLQYAKGVDPSLAVYASYAYNDLHRDDRLSEMNTYMRDDLGASLFDVAMMARAIERNNEHPTLGFAPLLAQGWAYLDSRAIRLPLGLEALPRMLTGSVWTMFDAHGVDQLRNTIFKGAQPWQQVD